MPTPSCRRSLRIAFHAPLKPPDHPHPSGDRRVARLLIAALGRLGHEVIVASRLRTREAAGDPVRQAALRAAAEAEAASLIERWREAPPDLWLTYHLYYKAPDLVGPLVTRALGLPYVAAEASHAPKRRVGPHAAFARAAENAIAGADAVFHVTAADRAALVELVEPSRLHRLPPFIDARPRPPRGARQGPVRLLAVAMMRPGDKLASYRALARALQRLESRDWRLTVVGDGAARHTVRAAFRSVADRIDWLGALPATRLPEIYRRHDIYVWPAINEAYGMALLEAQAQGLPVVAGRAGGVPEIVLDGVTGLVVPVGDAAAFARALDRLVGQPALRRRLGEAAWRHVTRRHGLAAAAATLDRVLGSLCRSS